MEPLFRHGGQAGQAFGPIYLSTLLVLCFPVFEIFVDQMTIGETKLWSRMHFEFLGKNLVGDPVGVPFDATKI